jgi:hypothetical protein
MDNRSVFGGLGAADDSVSHCTDHMLKMVNSLSHPLKQFNHLPPRSSSATLICKLVKKTSLTVVTQLFIRVIVFLFNHRFPYLQRSRCLFDLGDDLCNCSHSLEYQGLCLIPHLALLHNLVA